MLMMIVGEIANFAAYAFAPAILVTPLGALSIIVSAVLAHMVLKERLNVFGIVGCMLCIVGSITIVLHAPEEQPITSLLQALGIAMKLTFHGENQFVFIETYFCILIVGVSVITQLNYLNRALDMFNTAIVSPIYYVMFTLFTITASLILFKERQTGTQMATEACGFTTIVIGTFLLHATRELDVSLGDLTALLRAPASASGQGAARLSSMEMGRR
ncbi:g8043 [Coccomyxa viridis]|uniref:Probable magnesium transporter n=1 Tax=Coccomyxa viridis TaxID=1274662 RepID=A0ABP1G0I5_9CHLO